MEKTVRKPKFAPKQPDNFLAGLLLGGLAGAATMLFLAPQSGKETRQKLQQKAIELRDQTVATVDDTMAKVRTKADQIKDDVSNKAKELKQQGQDVLSEGLGRVSDAAKNGQVAVQGMPS
jgi:gas vesicle protein